MATTFTPGASDGTSNGTNVITAVASPASGFQRAIKNFVFRNADTVQTTVTISYVDGANSRDIYKLTLDPGDQVQCNQFDIQVLDTVSKSLTITLSAPKTTNDCPWVAAYTDYQQ